MFNTLDPSQGDLGAQSWQQVTADRQSALKVTWLSSSGGVASDRRTILEAAVTGPISSQVVSRLLDIVIAALALMFLAPMMVLIALAVRSSGPVLFGHQRIGRGGRMFTCWKFRTMHVDSERILQEVLASCSRSRMEWQRDHKLRSDPRVGRVGQLLRKSSLDELPQLLNVLAGTMSIVGPRPIVQAEAFRYGRYLSVYCQVRPGITGLWQVSGRNLTTYRRRIACDVAYVRSKRPINDLRIVWRTIPAVFLRHGAF